MSVANHLFSDAYTGVFGLTVPHYVTDVFWMPFRRVPPLPPEADWSPYSARLEDEIARRTRAVETALATACLNASNVVPKPFWHQFRTGLEAAGGEQLTGARPLSASGTI
jgi:hypothetical protein